MALDKAQLEKLHLRIDSPPVVGVEHGACGSEM